MSGLINELIDVMTRQEELCGELLGLSKEKKDGIIRNMVQDIQKITSLENILISKNRKLEAARIQIFKDLATVLNKKEEDLTVRLLAEAVQGRPEHDILLEKAASLKQTVQDLKKANELNKELIQQSLDYIDFSVNVMRSSMNKEPCLYSKTGDIIESDRGFFDAKQ